MSHIESNNSNSHESIEITQMTLEGLGYTGSNPVEVEETAARLLNEGIIFQKIPNEVYPNMPYTTADELADSRATLYSSRHINRMISNGTIPAIDFNGKHLLTPESVEQLLQFQEERLDQETTDSFRRPGARSIRTPRLKRHRLSSNS
jgi:hypothetical protein